MSWLENRQLPGEVRLKILPSFCDEEKDIIRLANGDIGLDELAQRHDERNASEGVGPDEGEGGDD